MNRSVLTVIIVSQFCCTSVWFAGNAVMDELVHNFGLQPDALGYLTSAVQFGFIIGTLLFAILSIADRFSPSKVFFACALLAALCNAGMVWSGNQLGSLLVIRFLTGFFLAGIYPVGMKIAADYFQKGLDKSLGFLVGALVLGTAFPHLLKNMQSLFPWKTVIVTTSILALLGGILMVLLVPDGPFRKPGLKVQLSSFVQVFKNDPFRSAAFGYFGHMWELYSFWAFVPVVLLKYLEGHSHADLNIPLWSFLIIAVGGAACVIGGFVAENKGTAKTAFGALSLSGVCCLLCPFLFAVSSQWLFIFFLLIWGMAVVADSPLFSTLVAQNADPEVKGTALTIVNCLGYVITILSIQLLTLLLQNFDSPYIFWMLVLGPILGLLALRKSLKTA
ncbi:MFS transporter [Fulvivirga ligni]|uniref:MFS transporter n=1 Tax=Fulvivirga ligni TaxID=2904246 RepID=UPI001F36603F|nr:MFS transporter [Fulvivirga ligni]UII21509.1 MFS transporter [Fulvivirga ligni]